MNLGLGWINDVMYWLVTWLPSCDVIECTHQGVKVRASLFRSGIRIDKLDPGLYFYWPRTTKIYSRAVVRQPIDLPAQSVDTFDGKSILFSVSLVYHVTDVVKVLTRMEDPDYVIKEIGAAAATDCIATRTWKQLRENFATGTVEAEVLAATRAALRKYGVAVEDARLTDCTKHTPIRCEGGGANIIPIMGEENET